MTHNVTSRGRVAKFGGLWAAVMVAGIAMVATTASADEMTIRETGSTLLYPLFKVWADEYAKSHKGVYITTDSTGSAAGIEQVIAGKVEIGASDAYMSDAQAKRNREIINIPMAISALTVNYNLPALNATNLKLNGPILAGIYSGTIRSWDDKSIVALNPNVTLPHHEIIPIHRLDGAGDTFVFTQYLSFSTPSWEDRIGYGTTPAWPIVPGALSANGNAGVLQLLQQTPYALTYIGVSYHEEVARAELGTAALQSYSGEFLLPTKETVTAAAASLTPRTPPDERLTLVNAPGTHAYPLVNYEYTLVSTKQPNARMAQAVRKFLLWAIAPGEDNERYLEGAHFIPLPAHIWVLSHDQIELIK